MLNSTDVFLVLGRRGCGKSYLARRLQTAYPRKVIFDTLGEYSSSDGIICHGFDDFSQKVLETQNLNKFTLIFQFDIERENHSDEFNEALRVMYYRGSVLLCIEEVQNFASTHGMQVWLKNALLTGRHRKLGLLFTTQRPGECHKTIISQSNHVFCGSLHEKNDVDYVRSVLGEKAFSLSKLPERQFYYFQPGKSLQLLSNSLKSLPNNAAKSSPHPDTKHDIPSVDSEAPEFEEEASPEN